MKSECRVVVVSGLGIGDGKGTCLELGSGREEEEIRLLCLGGLPNQGQGRFRLVRKVLVWGKLNLGRVPVPDGPSRGAHVAPSLVVTAGRCQ